MNITPKQTKTLLTLAAQASDEFRTIRELGEPAGLVRLMFDCGLADRRRRYGYGAYGYRLTDEGRRAAEELMREAASHAD